MSQSNVRNLTGVNGGKLLPPGINHTGEFGAIQFTQDSQIHSYTGNIDETDASFSGLSVPAGFTMFGLTTQIQLSTGSAIVYDYSR
jgi:hypothetical protein